MHGGCAEAVGVVGAGGLLDLVWRRLKLQLLLRLPWTGGLVWQAQAVNNININSCHVVFYADILGSK